MKLIPGRVVAWFCFTLAIAVDGRMLAAEGWPKLPELDATVTLPAQEWRHQAGPRTFTALIHYPGGKRENVTPRTGVMLSLHNWGGENCVGTADPKQLAARLDVVAVCVNYLQSGKKASIDDPEPYDCGYLQALDALRALWFVVDGLRSENIPFDDGRLFATGGSGGGNVALMANKLAPRTFAAIVDLCGMKKLSHDIAFHLPGGSNLDARWSRDPKSADYLSPDEQEIRFAGHPGHLAAMKTLGTSARVFVVHGVQDTTCPTADAVELVGNMKAAGLDVVPHWVTPESLDGKVFTSAGHALGNRTLIVFQVAEHHLKAGGPESLSRKGRSDFDLRDEKVRYATPNGTFVVSYKDGFPVGRFEPHPSPVAYDEHQDLTYVRDRDGKKTPITGPDAWAVRRRHVIENLERVTGRLPGVMQRVPLDVKVVDETRVGDLIRRRITYQSDPFDRVSAWLFLPANANGKPGSPASPNASQDSHRSDDGSRASSAIPAMRLPAVLCLQQTTKLGKDEPAGLGGDPNLHYALHLAERGYVTLAPDYPSFGEHAYDFAPERGYVSGTMKAVWDNIRAVDLLSEMTEVDADRIGCIGHSLGGHNAMFTATFDTRIAAIVSSCGFCTFLKDDVPSWTGPRYMPRIATEFGNDAAKVPFDFTELVGAFAPRPFLACAAKQDGDFDYTGVEDAMRSARTVYRLFDKESNLEAYYSEGGHGFPADARDVAYRFLDRHLKREQ